jgi:hypothetical protein
MKKLKLIPILSLFLTSPGAAQETLMAGYNYSENGDQIHLSAVADKHQKVVLQWSCTVETIDNYFTVERSIDGKAFEVIGVIKLKALYAAFTDEKPALTKNYYRVKAASSQGKTIYSKVAGVNVSRIGSLKFYPNPVQKILIVRTESAVELKISDVSGKLRMSRQIPVGLQLVDVGSLEKGLYIITLYHKESNTVMTEKLLKD